MATWIRVSVSLKGVEDRFTLIRSPQEMNNKNQTNRSFQAVYRKYFKPHQKTMSSYWKSDSSVTRGSGAKDNWTRTRGPRRGGMAQSGWRPAPCKRQWFNSAACEWWEFVRDICIVGDDLTIVVRTQVLLKRKCLVLLSWGSFITSTKTTL